MWPERGNDNRGADLRRTAAYHDIRAGVDRPAVERAGIAAAAGADE